LGSYSSFLIAGKEIDWTKNQFDEFLVTTLFRAFDRIEFEEAVEGESGDIQLQTFYQYRTTADKIIDRLDVLGFTEKRAKSEFEQCRLHKLNKLYYEVGAYFDLQEVIDFLNCPNPGEHELYRGRNTWPLMQKSDVIFYEAYHYKAFLGLIEARLTDNLEIANYKNYSIESIRLHLTKPDLNIQAYPRSDQILQLFPDEISYFTTIRIILQSIPVKSEVIYDYTDLVGGGWTDEDPIDWESVEKIIVITEGSTDKNVLEKSLKLLYPHLYDYYHFMDFEGSRSQGSAGQLVNTLKSFIGAGIKNRVVFLFDNDTAAKEALSSIKGVRIPINFKVTQYPALSYAESYPTMGPTGISSLDINGLACGIELYLGLDSLTIDGTLSPVQWRGYSEKVEAYQGEVLAKKAVQNQFFEKVDKCVTDPSLISKFDWTGIDALLQHLLFLFSEDYFLE